MDSRRAAPPDLPVRRPGALPSEDAFFSAGPLGLEEGGVLTSLGAGGSPMVMTRLRRSEKRTFFFARVSGVSCGAAGTVGVRGGDAVAVAAFPAFAVDAAAIDLTDTAAGAAGVVFPVAGAAAFCVTAAATAGAFFLDFAEKRGVVALLGSADAATGPAAGVSVGSGPLIEALAWPLVAVGAGPEGDAAAGSGSACTFFFFLADFPRVLGVTAAWPLGASTAAASRFFFFFALASLDGVARTLALAGAESEPPSTAPALLLLESSLGAAVGLPGVMPSNRLLRS